MLETISPPNEEVKKTHSNHCLSNAQDTWNELFTRYNRKIYKTALRILGDEASAEDALQQTLLNVYRGISRFCGNSNIATWITKITVNVCLTILYKRKKMQYVELKDEPPVLWAAPKLFTNPMAYTSLQELRLIIKETFDHMSDKHRIVVRLHDMEGLTIQEIARTINCPVGTARSRLFYGRQEFRALLSHPGNGSNKRLHPVLN